MSTHYSRRSAKADTSGLSITDSERLLTWMPEIAGEHLGHLQRDGSSFRAGESRALIINANGAFHDFREDKHSYGPLELIRHLHSLDEAGAVDRGRQWLATHVGNGALSGAEADDADEGDAAEDTFHQAMIDQWWGAGQLITGTPAEVYLNSRALKPNADDLDQLRWLPDFRGEEGAMLAAVRDNEGGLVALQMTFIDPAGQKSSISPVRRTHRGPRDWGSRGAVRFGALTGQSVYISEGLEDALSVRQAGHGPAIAILGVARLGRLELPDNIEKVVFVRDDDPAGSPAQIAMARGLVLLMASGKNTRLTHLPASVAGDGAPPLKDVNDLLQYAPAQVGELLVAAEPPLFRRATHLMETVLDATSRLSALQYELGRDQIRRALDYRVTALDKERNARIAARVAQAEEAGEDCDPHDIPWPDPVTDLGALMDAAVTEISRYIVGPKEVIDAVVLWCVFAHIIQHEQLGVDVAPRLAIQAASTQCGKTRMGECVACLTPRDRMSGSISAASIYRSVHALKPTLLIDEVDNLFRTEGGEALRGILNSGYSRRSAFVERTERTDDGQLVPVRFSTFTGICTIGIGRLGDTQQNRSVVATLRRKMGSEEREHLPKGESAMLFELRRKLIRLTQDLTELPDVVLDPRLRNRKGDNWRWLLRLAAEAGGEWPERALAAALHEDDEDDDQNQLTALLAAIWEVFATRDVVCLETQTLIDDLLELDDGLWKEVHKGKPITEYYLRGALKMVIPNTPEMEKARRWKDGKSRRGYAEVHFEDHWLRYLNRPKPSALREKTSRAEGGSRPDSSDPSDTSAENVEDTSTYTVSDEVSDGRAAGPSDPASDTSSDTVKAKQTQYDSPQVSDGSDEMGDNTPLRAHTFPRGATRRSRPSTNGAGGKL